MTAGVFGVPAHFSQPRLFPFIRYYKKIERMKEEVNPDVTLTHDTGCVTTLDKSQFAAQAHKRK
ncbi:MAG: hypothetical protein Ct9H300mP28_02060 [Pseudomonadota bacterium]|nr:MAG: hypothetical protein Ct9H300mP28_02060 [Pseudomonadota bacterium]